MASHGEIAVLDADLGLRARARAWLPSGNTLSHEVWLRRHRWLVGLLAAQGVGIAIYALVQGFSPGHSAAEGGVLIAFAAAAWLVRDRQRLAGAVCSVGLITSSALLVHVSGGLIEAHFHFFVMISLLALYEDWIPFLVAGAYVLLHHGVAGTLQPHLVYNHPDAIAQPFKWAAIHALFVTAAALAAVITWRLNEEHRLETRSAYRLARRRQRSLAEAQELAKLGGFEYEIESERTQWSNQLYRVLGLDPRAFVASADALMARIDPADHAQLEEAFRAAVDECATFATRCRYQHPDGSVRIMQLRGEIVADGNGQPARIAGTFQDVTERERAREEALKRAAAQRAVAELGELALGAADLNDLFKQAIATISGVLGVEMAAVTELIPADDEFVILAEVGMGDSVGVRYPSQRRSQSGYALLEGKAVVVSDWENERRFAQSAILSRLGVRSSISAIIKRREGAFGILGVLSREPSRFEPDDISFVQAVANVLSAAIDRVEAEEEIRHRSMHDPLTGLPNRVLFVDRVDQALAHCGRDGTQVGVLFCDLDQFKLVNDSLGHDAGDELLSAVAPRLSETLRPGDTVARFGGDEFGILIPEATSVRDVTRIAERVAAALTAPFVLRGREHFVTASIGIAIGDGGDASESLIRDADLAMYRAKERGRGRYEIFDKLMRARAVDHLRIENDLRRALERDELRVHYQPMVSLTTGRITGFEALVRWQHPERGLVSPGEFIPLAEESGLIVEVGDRVLEMACHQAASWQAERPDEAPIGISVNISARQLADRGFPDRVRRVLESSGLQPLCLSLEVTETMLVDELEGPAEGFRRLKELGVGVVLDDFGTGFSSLGYLRRFPFDLLKIDRSFVDQLTSNTANAAIVTAVTGIAEALGLGVVAEGVETEEQLEAVSRLGCHYAQGFLFSRPLPPLDAAELLRAPDLRRLGTAG